MPATLRTPRSRPRRALIGLAATAFTVVALAGSANASPGQVTQIKYNGPFAEAFWSTSSATSYTEYTIQVSGSGQHSDLFADQFTANLDAMGHFTGGTDTFADVTTGFSVAIDKTHLTSASTSGSGLPATTCSVDANFNDFDCHATTIDVTATWTGVGPITRTVQNHHLKANGFSETDHFNGTNRGATATGTLAGTTLGASEFAGAALGFTNAGYITRCIGLSC